MPESEPQPRLAAVTVTAVNIPLDLVNRVMVYLAMRPFQEVAELISALKTAGDASVAEQQKAAVARSSSGG